MNQILIELEAWVTATILAAAMLAGWGIGWWRGRLLREKATEATDSKFNDATLALLGLLLAFTFSMSLARHDERRQMVVTDSNAIGDFYTCASLLKGPARSKLQDLIRVYVEHRLSMASAPLEKSQLDTKLSEVQEMHNRMQAAVEEAVAGGTPVVVPLVNTLNEVTSSHAARLAASRNRLPTSIVVLLFLAAIVVMVLTGRHQGASGKRELAATLGFVVLVSMVVWVTLDLNEPRRGFITVSQEPMQRLLTGMAK